MFPSFISTSQAKAFDNLAQEKLGIPSIVLMENAGRSVAEEALKMINRRQHVAIICGVGNNGGDGLVAARHLLNAGIKTDVYIVGEIERIKADPKINLDILTKMGCRPKKRVSRSDFKRLKKAGLVIDALFGIGLTKPVGEPFYAVIDFLNNSGVPVLAVDVPSGLDADSGKPLGIAVRAKKTVTFVAMKKGFLKPSAKIYCGKVVVRGIGVGI